MEQNLKRFPLQFFAEQENEDVAVENQEETSEAEDEEEEVFQDDEEITDDVEDKVEETPESHTEGNKTKQTKQENEYFKKLRLSSKKTDKNSSNATYEKGRINGILEAVNHINPFTNEKIEDDEDVQEFLIMREIKDNGLDPVDDYSKYLKKLARERQAEKKQKMKETEFVQNDLQIFNERYPDKKINEVMLDEDFVSFASVSLGKVPIADLYENYEKFMNNARSKSAKEIEAKVNSSKARSKASSGALGNTSAPQAIDYSKMSDSDLEKMIAKAKAGHLSKKFR